MRRLPIWVSWLFIAKDDAQLVGAFRQAGWNVARKSDFASFFKAIKAVVLKKDYSTMPIAPLFWNAKIQDFGFVKPFGENMSGHAHHLRIWRTTSLSENGNYTYVGLANATDGTKWGVVPRISPALDVEREFLYQDLKLSGAILRYWKRQLVAPQTGTNFVGDRFFTDGQAYMISINQG